MGTKLESFHLDGFCTKSSFSCRKSFFFPPRKQLGLSFSLDLRPAVSVLISEIWFSFYSH